MRCQGFCIDSFVARVAAADHLGGVRGCAAGPAQGEGARHLQGGGDGQGRSAGGLQGGAPSGQFYIQFWTIHRVMNSIIKPVLIGSFNIWVNG